MPDKPRHDIPLEQPLQPGRRRSGEGSQSVGPHLQQQAQAKLPPELKPLSDEAPEKDA